jgi:hypothetical protein
MRRKMFSGAEKLLFERASPLESSKPSLKRFFGIT